MGIKRNVKEIKITPTSNAPRNIFFFKNRNGIKGKGNSLTINESPRKIPEKNSFFCL